MNFIRISYISLLFILISCDSFKTVNLYESVIDQPDPYESFSYKDIFKKQLEYLANKGDVLITISSSGNSENIIRAFNTAKDQKITTVGFTPETALHRMGMPLDKSRHQNFICKPLIKTVGSPSL